MSESNLTALGVHRGPVRAVTVAAHRRGVHLRVSEAGGLVILSPDEADHVAKLLTEFSTNARLAARQIDEVIA